jgi:conjugative relaxase-like TrwC/TraI family protein
VLSIGKLGNSVDQLGYYEQQVAQGLEDYFSGRGEAPGRWTGRGTALLGVRGQVERAGFLRAMAGCDPRTAERLKPEHGRAKVAALDLTFSAPKSVSVLFAIADEPMAGALLEAHEQAVAAAFGYLEQEACFTRRGHNGVERVRGDGFLAAAYRHRLSRAGDPQLHTHVVVANMTRANGRWTALEAHGLYEHKSAGGAVYRAVLRAEVRRRLPWVSWRATDRGLFGIDGVPAAVLREFSRRRAEIEERAEVLTGVAAAELSRERLQGIALATRKAKEYGVDGRHWHEEARARAAEHGLGAAEVSGLQRRIGGRGARSVAPDAVAADAARRLSGPEGLTGQHNTFAPRHAMAELAGEFVDGALMDQLREALGSYLSDASVVALGVTEGEWRFTARELLACESAIIRTAELRIDEQAGRLAPDAIDAASTAGQYHLTAEQTAAARQITGDGQGVSVLQALAGTGKTRVLATISRAYADAGFTVAGVAPTGRAARELAGAAEIAASTIQRLLADLERSGGFPARSVVLFDEAGTAPTRPSAALFAAAHQAGAKVIVVGDSGQLPSVAAGGWFAGVSKRIGGPQLRQVMRQCDPTERDALAALHAGQADDYLAHKHDQSSLEIHPGEGDAVAAILADWDRARRGPDVRAAVMIARDNATRETLNRRAQLLRLATGELGDEVLAIRDHEFRTGDRVIARRNDRNRDVDNGTLGTVVKIDDQSGSVTVEIDALDLRRLDLDYVSEHLELAYALTGHGAQGATVDWAGVIGRPSEFTREWAYTALSRARRTTRIHVIAEPRRTDRDRAHYAPMTPAATASETLETLSVAMRRAETEPLATDHPAIGPAAVNQTTVDGARPGSGRLPTGPQPQAVRAETPREPDWRALIQRRSRLGRSSPSLRM